MFSYRLTKYDPGKRSSEGIFVAEEWTSISDIGRTFGLHTVSLSDYLLAENAYVEGATALLAAADIRWMRVTDLERRAVDLASQIDDTVLESCSQLKEGQTISITDMQPVIRGCLREYVWCRLTGRGGSYLHFGYDYYMYIGLPGPADTALLPPAMYLERFESPYPQLED